MQENLIPWAVIEKFAKAAMELAAVESQISQLHERRVKAAHQLRAAIDRQDKDEASKAYFSWLGSWDKIQRLHQQLAVISTREAGKFKPDEGLEGEVVSNDGATSLGS